jgi:hypothetical protein
MKLHPECIGCLFNQTVKAFTLLKSDIDPSIILKAQKKVMKYLLENNMEHTSSPIVGKFLYRLVGEMMNVEDPYKKLKHHYNQLALKHYEDLKEFVKNSEDPIFEAIVLSALANTIDFASPHDIDIVNDLKNFSPKDLVINDYPLFKKLLEKETKLLVLLDNAGEIVFDKILIEILLSQYPELEIICAVRAAPIINDVTMEDAKYVSLTEIVKVIESSYAPGIDFSDITEEFRHYFFEEDCLILSKGQGNFETLTGNINTPENIQDKDIFYLLKAKCSLMERLFGVEKGSLIFKKRTPEF